MYKCVRYELTRMMYVYNGFGLLILHTGLLFAACGVQLILYLYLYAPNWMLYTKVKMCEKIYTIEYNSKYGRHLIAARDIKPGECVIHEPPIIHAPGYSKIGTGSYHQTAANENYNSNDNENSENGVAYNGMDLKAINVCVACYQNLDGLNPSLCKCDICGLYLCSETCCSQNVHRFNECQILRDYPAKNFSDFKTLLNFITVIRCLFCRHRDLVKWTQIKNLQSKTEELEKLGVFKKLEPAFNFLNWTMFGEHDEKNHIVYNEKYSEFESVISAAKHALGALRINAFSHFSGTWSREGLYFLSSLMSHSCVMNTDRQMDQDGTMIVRAAVNISKGERITTSYTSYLSNNIERKLEIENTWLFSCDCRRCLDPTECGTFLSNIYCSNCHNGTLQPFSYAEAKKSCPIWKCSTNSCDSSFPNSKALEILQIVENSKPTSIDSNHRKEIELWLRTFDTGKFLHKNHSVFTQVKFILCQLYDREKEGSEMISVQQLLYKAELCDDLLDIFRCLYPGIYQFRGVILFELWNCINNIRHLSQMNTLLMDIINEKGWTEKYTEHLKNESISILQYALPNSSEEAMALVLQESVS